MDLSKETTLPGLVPSFMSKKDFNYTPLGNRKIKMKNKYESVQQAANGTVPKIPGVHLCIPMIFSTVPHAEEDLLLEMAY